MSVHKFRPGEYGNTEKICEILIYYMENLGRYPLLLRVIRHKNGKDIPVQAWAGPEGSSS